MTLPRKCASALSRSAPRTRWGGMPRSRRAPCGPPALPACAEPKRVRSESWPVRLAVDAWPPVFEYTPVFEHDDLDRGARFVSSRDKAPKADVVGRASPPTLNAVGISASSSGVNWLQPEHPEVLVVDGGVVRILQFKPGDPQGLEVVGERCAMPSNRPLATAGVILEQGCSPTDRCRD